MLKLVYEDISPTAKQDSTITCTDKKSYIDLEELKDNDLKVWISQDFTEWKIPWLSEYCTEKFGIRKSKYE